MVHNDYLPSINPQHLCSALQLCSIRQHGTQYFVARHNPDKTIEEIPFDDIVDATTYEGLPLHRTYASGHVFVSSDCQKTYMLTTEKHGKQQIQFTGGSPLEDINKDVVIVRDDKIVRFHLGKIEDNALLRTKLRCGVDVTENYTELPLVDRVMMKGKDEVTGAEYWRLVCLLHYVVKSYTGTLEPAIGVEGVVGGDRYAIDDVIHRRIPNLGPSKELVMEVVQKIGLAPSIACAKDIVLAPNADIVMKKTVDLIQNGNNLS